jgi:hypothetical protein
VKSITVYTLPAVPCATPASARRYRDEQAGAPAAAGTVPGGAAGPDDFGVAAAGAEVVAVPVVAGLLVAGGAADGVAEPQAVASAARPVIAAPQIARRVIRPDEVMSGVLPWAAPLAI